MAKMGNKKLDLTSDEWWELRHFVIGAFPFLTTAKTEVDILSFIMDRTLNFEKFEEWFIESHLQEGCLSLFGYLGVMKSPMQIWRALNRLSKNKIIIITRRSGKKFIRLNIPAIIDFYFEIILQVWKSKLEDTPFRKRIVGLNGVKAKVAEYFKKQKWEVPAIACKGETVAKMEKVMQEALETIKENEKKRKEKISKKELTPTMVPAMFRVTAWECGLTYDEEELLEGKGRVYGMAKNWLKECKELGIDARKVIRAVCEDWPSLQNRVGVLRSDSREFDVSFKLFYSLRKEIIEWL